MQPFTDKQMESEIATMLRWGVTLSAVIVFLGGMIYLRGSHTLVPDYAHFHATAEKLSGIASVFHGAIHLDAESMMQLGILLLIATPVARVVLCVVGFARQRDSLYIAISIAVLAVLIYSLVPGNR